YDSRNLNQAEVNRQIQNSTLTTKATTTTAAQQNNPVAKGATGIASCLGSQIIAKAIVGVATQVASKALSGATDMLLNVPVAESGSTGAAVKMETSARVGGNISIFGIGIPAFPSWDAMGYCIVNTMIIYIADSTIQWINTGFEGNPAFLNNPNQFFEDLANQEKVAFLQGLAYGVNSSVCGVFKNSVVSAILSRYGKNQQNMYGQQGYQNGGYNGGYGQNGAISACPFDQTPGKLNAFMNGGFNQGGGWDTWFQVSQNPMSNPYDTYFAANDRMNQQVQAVQLSQNRELNWNNGYLSFRKCENGEKDKSKCSITTPGTVIQNQLNSTLNLGKNRLVLAEKFDQVVTAVVDQLITTALDKALDQNSYSSSQGSSQYSNSNQYNRQYNTGSGTSTYVQPQYVPYGTTTYATTSGRIIYGN
ncbi:hypothetical protein H7Y21_00900, partial [Arenimonas sp.]|nr:hypothetical protein [Candidatus Parcubacteria bacterium]